MLPKSRRLKKNDFVGIKTKVIFRGTYTDVAVAPAPSLKFSCIISKKTVKRAIDRNKIKRRIYGILEKIKTTTPYFVFLYPKQPALDSNYKLLQAEIYKVFDTL